MALDFPNSPTDGDYFTDAFGQRWLYEAPTTCWTKVEPAAYTGTLVVGTQTLTFDKGVLVSVV